MNTILRTPLEGKTTALYQVCFDLTDEETQAREVRALIKAGTVLNCQNLNLLTLEKPAFAKVSAGRPDVLKLPQEIKTISVAEFL